VSKVYESLRTVPKLSIRLKEIAPSFSALSGETSIIVFVEVGDLAIRQGMCHTGSIFDTKTQPFFNSSSDGQQHKAVIVQAMISASTVSRVMA